MSRESLTACLWRTIAFNSSTEVPQDWEGPSCVCTLLTQVAETEEQYAHVFCMSQVAGQQGAYVARMINRGYVPGRGGLTAPFPCRKQDAPATSQVHAIDVQPSILLPWPEISCLSYKIKLCCCPVQPFWFLRPAPPPPRRLRGAGLHRDEFSPCPVVM